MKLVKYGAVAALSTVLLASGVVGMTGANAAEKENGSEEGYERTMKSDSNVNFVPSDKETGPIDPTDPTKPDPEKPFPPKPGTAGPLSIDYASDFAFGTQEISTEDKTYFSKPQTYLDEELSTEENPVLSDKVGPTFVQVTDKRGSNKGWSLNLKQDHQFENKDTQNTVLTGAELHFQEGTAVTDGTAATPPATHEAKLDATGGSYSKIMTAKEQEGSLTWASMFGGSDALKDTEVMNAEGEKVTEKRDQGVSLTIPGKTQTDAVEYKTTLTWQLTNEPGNGTGNDLGEEEI